MTETAIVAAMAPANGTASQQKLKAAFSDDQNRTLHMDYNGPEHLFRIRFGTVQRLFFFEALSQKLILRNEYGVVMGQLSAAPDEGWVRLDDKRYRFAISKGGAKLSLMHSKSAPVLTCTVPDDIRSGNLDARHKQNLMHCLVFAFAWTLS
jgi:hypothetical protein